MKIRPLLTAAAFLAASYTPAAAADHFICRRLSGGPMPPLSLTIDYDKKNVDASPSLQPDTGTIPDAVEITDATVKWWVMRGGVVFDRRTHELDWDMTDEHDYLEYTGQFVDPIGHYRGKMRCKIDAKAVPKG
jgi:hypothetical protein